METLSRGSCPLFMNSFLFARNPNSNQSSCTILFPKSSSLRSPTVSVLKSPSSATERAEEDVSQEFFRDRQLKGDLITKYSDILFQKGVMGLIDDETANVEYSSESAEEALADEPDAGFLKLTSTQEWLMGETSAPINRKPTNKELQDNRERRRRLEFLRYEALKRELQFMTLGVGAACTGYCLFIFSIQAAVSYASGVGFSCLYLQLLYQHADNISQDSVPHIFREKKIKKIGIRSEDLKDSLEKTVRGCGIALSSPRLVIPAAIYGIWVLLHQTFATDLFDFQIVPAMLGLFAYKAAALVQVYRDNEDLEFIFPDE
ncbi:hypothetical protein SOVF_105580 [Spinacia oleracea]|uniref:Uncharacterized protein isoform X1 n=1 Tax=Spinacia oleracea TaxID=3562 RepID=A0A9R0IFJ4_SPIOL|nr:uncharacterized protein LOC110787927 isoform X1 [Spinacia oleracea]KNA14630.1 hypothetical protein SOVF_105580 [Spinacia oleracea]